MRPWECSQTDRYTHSQTDRLTDTNWFYNLSHAMCYSYGKIILAGCMACTKRLYFHFRSKIWRHHRVPRSSFPKGRENFSDSRKFKADIGLLRITGYLGGGGQNRGRGRAILTPNELVLTFGGSYVSANFGENRSRNVNVRMLADGQMHTLRDWQSDRRKPILWSVPCYML